MDALINEVTEILSAAGQFTKDQKVQLGVFLNERQNEYGNYEMIPAKNEGWGKSNLFLAFGRKITGIFGVEADIILEIESMVDLTYGFKSLQLPKLFEE